MSDDDFSDAPRPIGNVTREGAAAAGSDPRDLSELPRLLRYADLLAADDDPRERMLAEIVEAAPTLGDSATAWAEHPMSRGWKALASALDAESVRSDQPCLRSLADAVRLVSMEVGDAVAFRDEALRVVAALRAAVREALAVSRPSHERLADYDQATVGWTCLAAGDRGRFIRADGIAHKEAGRLGRSMTTYIVQAIEKRMDAKAAIAASKRESKEATDANEPALRSATNLQAGADCAIVCPPLDTKANAKLRDACRGHEHAIGMALPLAPVPNLVEARRSLIAEFPYAADVVDFLLAPLVGRVTVRFPPVVIVGPPGAGKSRLAGRFAEVLGVGLWRTDAARADGNAFGGTDRRWYTSEPAHPFLAVSRSRMANPVILLDELEKAASRSDYGRLWDALLAFLEVETSSRYPDPCLQVDLNLGHVSYVATANSLLPVPPALRDRFRMVDMPEPRANDLDRLVAPLISDFLKERGLDERWAEPLSTAERDVLASRWKGGSVRRLRAFLDVVLRSRDRGRSLN